MFKILFWVLYLSKEKSVCVCVCVCVHVQQLKQVFFSVFLSFSHIPLASFPSNDKSK